MSLSKPRDIAYGLLGAYLQRLYTNPLRTKAITSCVLAIFGNVLAQKLSGARHINEDSIIAFALFGLFFGGPVPHYFYSFVQSLTKSPLGILLVERLIYMPCFQALALFLLAIFEGKTRSEAYNQLQKLYLPTVIANLKYLTIFHYINVKYVPPMLRVLVVNFIGLAWVLYLTNQRARVSKKK